MKMNLGVSAICLAALLACAEAATQVAGVNMPAWLDRDGARRPLLAGTVLQSSDVISTGAGARVLLTLPEGSEIKLGENAVFRADVLGSSDGRKSAFTATLDVVKGAFRFTTALFAKERSREVDIRVATVTAGIRGTDVWGKSDDERDIVCLLEGKIAVSRQGETTQAMDTPLSFFIAPKNQPSLPIAMVDAQKVKQEWMPQTDLQAGRGVASSKGAWRLTIATVDTQADALRWLDTLAAAGYAAKIQPAADGSKYRVQVMQLASAQDAKALGERLKAELSAPEAGVSR